MLSGRIGPGPTQDRPGHTLFKRAAWSWLPGPNPGWGMELSSSILRADAIPLLAAQIADLQPGFARLASFFTPEPAAVPLQLGDPFWAEAARRHSRIRAVPNRNRAAWWEEVAVHAATKGLETDAAGLARLDPGRIAAPSSAMAERLVSGNYEPCTLYVLGDADALAHASRDPGRDPLEVIDLVMVLVPGWSGPDGVGPGDCAG